MNSFRTSVIRCVPRPGRVRVRQEGCDGPTVKDSTLDRGVLEHAPFLGLESVDAGGEKRLNGGRDLECALSALCLHRDELLDEERVSFRCLDDPELQLVGDIAEPVDERLDLLLFEGTERDQSPIRLRRRPAVSTLE